METPKGNLLLAAISSPRSSLREENVWKNVAFRRPFLENECILFFPKMVRFFLFPMQLAFPGKRGGNKSGLVEKRRKIGLPISVIRTDNPVLFYAHLP